MVSRTALIYIVALSMAAIFAILLIMSVREVDHNNEIYCESQGGLYSKSTHLCYVEEDGSLQKYRVLHFDEVSRLVRE